MVKEIRYNDYKKFCAMLPCKDLFYYVDNLFVTYNGKTDKIYCVKAKKMKICENVRAMNRLYEDLEAKGMLSKVSLSEFVSGVNKVDTKSPVNDKFYSRSFLVCI